jgi:hypothetical protein
MKTFREQHEDKLTQSLLLEKELLCKGHAYGHNSENFLRTLITECRTHANPDTGVGAMQEKVEFLTEQLTAKRQQLDQKLKARGKSPENVGFNSLGDALAENLAIIEKALEQEPIVYTDLPEHAEIVHDRTRDEIEMATETIQLLRNRLNEIVNKEVRALARQGKPLSEALAGLNMIGERVIHPFFPVTYTPKRGEEIPAYISTFRNGKALTSDQASRTEDPSVDVMRMQSLDTLFLLLYPKTPETIPAKRIDGLLRRAVYGKEVVQYLEQALSHLESLRPAKDAPDEERDNWIATVDSHTEAQIVEKEATLTR